MTDRYLVSPRTMSLIFQDDKVLLYKASDKKEWAGIYNPVGGHIEEGEDIIDAANREILEETGLKVDDTQLKGIMHVTNFYGKNCLMFITTSTSQEEDLMPSDEGELEWVRIQDLGNLHIFEDVKPLIEAVLKLKPGQIFTGVSKFNDKNQLIDLTIYPR